MERVQVTDLVASERAISFGSFRRNDFCSKTITLCVWAAARSIS